MTANYVTKRKVKNMQHEINLGFLLKCLKKCWLLMVVCALVLAIAAGIFVNVTMNDTYSASITFYARNNDVNSDIISQGNLSAATRLINDYIQIIKSDAVLTQISDELKATDGIELTPQQIDGTISASSEEESSMFVIIITHTDPKVTKAIAAAVEKVTPEAVTKIAKSGHLTTPYIAEQVGIVIRRLGRVNAETEDADGLGKLDWKINRPNNFNEVVQDCINKSTAPEGQEKASVEQVIAVLDALEARDDLQYSLIESDNFEALLTQYLNENTSLLKDTSLCFTPIEATSVWTNSPNALRYALIAAAAGAVIVYLIFLIIGIFESNITSEEDLKKIIDKPVIGTIPAWETADKKERRGAYYEKA